MWPEIQLQQAAPGGDGDLRRWCQQSPQGEALAALLGDRPHPGLASQGDQPGGVASSGCGGGGKSLGEGEVTGGGGR